MKRLSVMLVLIFGLVCLPSALGITVPDVALGGDDQERGETASQTVTITNSLSTAWDNVTVAVTDVATGFTINLDKSTLSDLDATGGTTTSDTVTVSVTVPKNFDAINEDGSAYIPTIGKLRVTADNMTSGEQDVVFTNQKITLQAENRLVFENIMVIIDGQDDDLDDGDTVDEVLPGQEFCVKVEIRNDYNDDDEDPTMDNIRVKIESDDDDFRYEDTETKDDLDPDKEDTITLDCDEIDLDADGSISFDVWLTGEATDNDDSEVGGRHGEKWDFEIDIEREDHEIIFLEPVRFSNTRITPDTRTLEVSTELYNRGDDDEPLVSVEIRSSELGIDFEKTEIDIDKSEGERFNEIISLPEGIVPRSAPYLVTVGVRPRPGDSYSDSKTIELTVVEPVSPQPTPDPTSTPTPTPTPDPTPPVVNPPTPSNGGTEDESEEISQSLYVGLLVAGILIVVLLIVLLLVVAFRKN